MPVARRTTIAVAGQTRRVTVERRAIAPSNETAKSYVPLSTPGRTVLVPVAKLDELLGKVRRLTVSRHDPERYFEDRSEIEAAIRRLIGG